MKKELLKLTLEQHNQAFVARIQRENEEREAYNESEVAKIGRIRYLELDGHEAGIGYLEGKLVEYQYSGRDKMRYGEITLAESLEWVEKMDYADWRLDVCAQSDGEPFIKWIRDLHNALEVGEAAADGLRKVTAKN